MVSEMQLSDELLTDNQGVSVSVVSNVTATTPPPRNHKSLNLKQKIELIKAVEADQKPKREIAKDFGIKSNTLSTIVGAKAKLYARFHANDITRKRARPSKYPELEEALMTWFNDCKNSNMIISGPLITHQAESLAKKLQHTEFKASQGWLDRFKKRHGLVFRKASGESPSLRDWKQQFSLLTPKCTSENTWNADGIDKVTELGLINGVSKNNTSSKLDKAVQTDFKTDCSRCLRTTKDTASSPIFDVASCYNFSAVKQEPDVNVVKSEWDDFIEPQAFCEARIEEEEHSDCDRSNDSDDDDMKMNQIRPTGIQPTSFHIKPRCQCKRKYFHCSFVTDERRQQLFNHFWQMELTDRKAFICKYVDAETVKQQRVTTDKKRRRLSLHYFFPVLGKRLTVCNRFFVNTLCIRPATVLDWVESILF